MDVAEAARSTSSTTCGSSARVVDVVASASPARAASMRRPWHALGHAVGTASRQNVLAGLHRPHAVIACQYRGLNVHRVDCLVGAGGEISLSRRRIPERGLHQRDRRSRCRPSTSQIAAMRTSGCFMNSVSAGAHPPHADQRELDSVAGGSGPAAVDGRRRPATAAQGRRGAKPVLDPHAADCSPNRTCHSREARCPFPRFPRSPHVDHQLRRPVASGISRANKTLRGITAPGWRTRWPSRTARLPSTGAAEAHLHSRA